MRISVRRHIARQLARSSLHLIPLAALAGAFTASAAAADTPVAADAQSTGLPEVVVTARKRQESLRDVPVAVSAISGDTLESSGVDDVEGLIGTVPSLATSQNQTFGPLPNQRFLVLRGVGATASNEPAVATFVDGVYEPSLGFDEDYLDVERVEVLRGPQGALFGRNTEGGAVNIITRQPGPDFRAKLSAGAGDYGTYDVGGSVSGPTAYDGLYAGAAVQYSSSDGYLRNTTLNEHADNSQSVGGRLSLRLAPGNGFDAVLRVEAFGNRYGYLGFGVPNDGSDRYVVLDAEKVPSTDNSFGASLTMSQSLGSMKLTSITGYNRITTHYWYDFSSDGDVGNFQDQRTGQSLLSEELRLAGQAGRKLQWLAGLYYFDEKLDQHRNFAADQCSICVFPPVFNPDNVVLEHTDFSRPGWALFGQVSYHPTGRIDLSVGGRVSGETAGARQIGRIYVPGVGSNDQYDGTSSKHFSNFSPSGSAAYHFNTDVMSYVTISRGYKSGGYDKYPGSSAAVGIPFRSETSTNYELGVKSLVAHHRVELNAALFYIALRNQQLATTVISPVTGLPVGVTANVGASSSRGAELEFAWKPIQSLELSANGSYVATRFDRLDSAVGTRRVGDAFPYVPKVTASTEADYTIPLIDDLSVVLTAADRFVGSHYNGNGSPPFDPVLQVPSYDVLDTRITLRSASWDATVYVNNALNRFNVTSVYQPAFQPFTRASVLPPRTFGVRATYRW